MEIVIGGTRQEIPQRVLKAFASSYLGAEIALEDCGISGIYANFYSVGDAIWQMSNHIRDTDNKLEAAQTKLERLEHVAVDLRAALERGNRENIRASLVVMENILNGDSEPPF